MLGDDIEALNYDSLEAVAQLTRSDRYNTIMAAVRQAEADDAAGTSTAWAGPSEEDPTYKCGGSQGCVCFQSGADQQTYESQCIFGLTNVFCTILLPCCVKHLSCGPVPWPRLLVDCNQLAVDIDNEIVVVYNFLRDRYKTKFPELESLVHNPLDYARVVQVGAGVGGVLGRGVAGP
jgi:U4/U6 small nuclear ribonucleoprotein PRP31